MTPRERDDVDFPIPFLPKTQPKNVRPWYMPGSTEPPPWWVEFNREHAGIIYKERS